MRREFFGVVLLGLSVSLFYFLIQAWVIHRQAKSFGCLYRYPENSCDALLRFGDDKNFLRDAFNCTTQRYNTSEISTCFARKSSKGAIVFMGDSRSRQMYNAVVNLVDHSHGIRVFGQNNMVHTDAASNMTMKLLWATYLDDTMIGYLQTLQKEKPALVVVNSGLWTMKLHLNETEKGQEEHRRNLARLKPVFQTLAEQTPVLWTLEEQVSEAALVAWHGAQWRAVLSNDQINVNNDAASTTFCDSNVKLWTSSRKISQKENDLYDGLHSSEHVVVKQVQNLMNYLCNDALEDPKLCCGSALFG